MIIEKFLENAEHDHDEAVLAQPSASDRASRRLFSHALISHRLFPIGIALWAAALVGGIVMALGPTPIERAAALTGVTASNGSTQHLFAWAAAALVAIIAFAMASFARRNAVYDADQQGVISAAGRRVRTVEEVETNDSDWPEEAPDEAAFAPGDAIEPLDITKMFEGEEASHDTEPHVETLRREMPLEEFGALPGRDAVWVRETDDTVDEPQVAQADDAATQAAPPPVEVGEAQQPETHAQPETQTPPETRLTALEKLRAIPLQELSLVQMVERFAAALSEHQERAETVPQTDQDHSEAAEREAALVEALKALSAFSHRGLAHPNAGQRGIQAVEMVSETEQELQHALAKLQTLRGAA